MSPTINTGQEPKRGEPSSETSTRDDRTSNIVALESQIRECFGRVVYAHKTHEKDGDLCARTLRRFKLLQIVVSSVTASGTVAVILADQLWIKLATALISLLGLFITGYMKGFDPGAAAQKHRDTAADLWIIRESYLSLLTDISAGTITLQKATDKRDQLQAALASIYKSAPHTTPKGYLKAQKALQTLEDYTFNDGEIDKFLPPNLKRTGGPTKV
ncbi:SLATT domain-containing protein [Rhizobium leguminosarum]|uniref:SLATT domain-containing protein n=1 Tax=Rhizobium leguminosarum TaxID=384 RepID=UPI001031F702|nr:SLATT domain-containing protein [Rhizobium leguminosarum]TBF52847.1 SLATT domain-containing protein [Rhizobium leguminosarum]TBF73941.1 SLATT domain-containing protein [Rhizobium leguminosarum]TBG04827.1 SLATT domain-containing protein [Rhizobium leguminosarum]TBG16976.1 SLATT domain-containing protein [Rhizobium leguminosarum]TBG21676.1 SLATT domain-containing protein [Rhizobium leguminosarum]